MDKKVECGREKGRYLKTKQTISGAKLIDDTLVFFLHFKFNMTPFISTWTTTHDLFHSIPYKVMVLDYHHSWLWRHCQWKGTIIIQRMTRRSTLDQFHIHASMLTPSLRKEMRLQDASFIYSSAYFFFHQMDGGEDSYYLVVSVTFL